MTKFAQDSVSLLGCKFSIVASKGNYSGAEKHGKVVHVAVGKLLTVQGLLWDPCLRLSFFQDFFHFLRQLVCNIYFNHVSNLNELVFNVKFEPFCKASYC